MESHHLATILRCLLISAFTLGLSHPANATAAPLPSTCPVLVDAGDIGQSPGRAAAVGEGARSC